jgi:hypothetical protein
MTPKIIQQIVSNLNPGSTSYYITRNNKFNPDTIYDENNEFNNFISDSKNWGDLINYIYNTGNIKSLVASPKKNTKNTFVVIDTKDTNKPAFEVQVKVVNNSLVLSNLNNKNKVTIIEFAESLQDMMESASTKKQVDVLIDELKFYKNKSSKELFDFLSRVVSTK